MFIVTIYTDKVWSGVDGHIYSGGGGGIVIPYLISYLIFCILELKEIDKQ